MQVQLDNREIYCNVSYTKGTKFSISITPEGLVEVRAPKKTSEEELIQYIQSNKKMILKFYERMDNQTYVSRNKSYTEEENFLYLGKACQLSEILNPIPDTKEQIQIELKRFYTQTTRSIIKERVTFYEKEMNVKAKSITIVDSPKTWGTCNSKRELTFNYRLCMAPMPVIDSVVIHELCHLFHLNHDRSFWRKVGTYDPNYKAHEQYLTTIGGFMTI